MLNNHQPLVSISVPVLNRPKDIALCLESLLKLDFPKEDYEIIVVDNGSTDNTKEVIQQFPVKYFFEPKRGRGAARNRGVRESKGKYLAFIDSDCVATPNWLTELVKAVEEKPHIAAFGGKIIAYKMDTWVERYIDHRRFFDQELAVEAFQIEDLPRFIPVNAIIKRDILEQAGNFDEELSSSIDTELGYRLILQGFQIGYAEKAIVCHCHRDTLKAYYQRRLEIGEGNYIIAKKYENILRKWPLSGNRIKFIAIEVLALFRLSIEFIIQIIKKEDSVISFMFLDFLGKVCFILGELKSCLKDIFNLLPKMSEPKNLDLDKIFHKGLSFSKNGWLLNPAEKVIWFLSNDLIKFINVSNRSFFGLNEASTRIWQVLCDTKDFSRTVKIVSAEYHIPEEVIYRDAEELLAQLEKEHLVVKKRTQ
ncbi:MAG: PqqD family peptide modification chaperone [Candidatus Omnitrophota bacterium]|nr:PqqD family peptide modification chaperone [Candidatus Omnitrophota bacterium]